MGQAAKKATEKNPSVLIDNIEVCTMLGVKPNTWRRRVAKGLSPLPFTATGARTYYRRDDVLYYLNHGLWPAKMTFRGKLPGVHPDTDPESESKSAPCLES